MSLKLRTTALIVTAAAVLPSFFAGLVSVVWGLYSFAFFILLLHLIIFLIDGFSNPRNVALSKSVLVASSGPKVLRKYHWFIRSPETAFLVSEIVKNVRRLAFLAAIICVWIKIIWMGIVFLVYFFISRNVVVNLRPDFYLELMANDGDQNARSELPVYSYVRSYLKMKNTKDEGKAK